MTFQFSAQDIPSNVSNHIALTVNVPVYLFIYKCRNAGSVGGGVGLLVTVVGLGQNTATYVSNFTLQKPINHPPVRLDVIYDVTHYSTLPLES